MHTKGDLVKLASLICAITMTAGIGVMAVDSKAIAKDYKAASRQVSVEESVAIAQPLNGAAVDPSDYIEMVSGSAVTYDQLTIDQQNAITEQKLQVRAAIEDKEKKEAAEAAQAAKAALDEKNAQEKKVAEAKKRAAEEKKKEEAAKKAAEAAKAKAAATQTQVQVVEYVEVEEVEEPAAATVQTTQTSAEEKKTTETTEKKAAAAVTTTTAAKAASNDNDGLYMNPTYDPNWNKSSHLSSWSGVYYGPSGKETYYNLNMSGVVSIMRGMGFSEDKYPYWVRDDGCKMLGNYIMVAADLGIRARGTLVPTSLGTGIVCDTGGFAASNRYQLDIATNW